MTIREELTSIAKERILILDGAMGSVIQSLNLNEKSFRGALFMNHPIPLEGCNDVLCLTRPGAISAIHDTYFEAGADIIETCSFNSTSISLSDYKLGDLAYDISFAAAEIARKSADKYSFIDKHRFVAGSIGPTAKSASLCPDVNNPSKRSITWDALEAAYYDNVRGLLDGGVDLLMVETVFDTLNAKAALFAISRLLDERKIDIPIIISAAVSNEAGRLLSGQSLEAFCASVMHVNPWAISINCSFSAQKILPFVRILSQTVPCLVGAYPNAGIPNQFGLYDETAEIMSANVEEFFKEELVNIIGGCCGSTPAHIAEIKEKAAEYKPRIIPELLEGQPRRCIFSGLEILQINDNTVHIRDTAGSDSESEKLLQALASGECEDAADIARNMIENGISILDIKTDDEKTLDKFLNFALMNPYVAKTPFIINSSKIDVLETGLKRLQGRGLAGPVNLADGDAEFIRKAQLIRRYGAAVLITLIDEKGPGENYDRKIDIARRMYQLLQKIDYPAAHIVFDLLVSEEDNSVCSWIRDNCPDVLLTL